MTAIKNASPVSRRSAAVADLPITGLTRNIVDMVFKNRLEMLHEPHPSPVPYYEPDLHVTLGCQIVRYVAYLAYVQGERRG